MTAGASYREEAARLIASAEGEVRRGDRHVVYDCGTGKPLRQGDTIVGHPTIGHGRNLEAVGIDDGTAQALLVEDLIDAEDAARGFVGQPAWLALNDARRAVLIDMAYNLGAQRLYGFTKLRAAILAMDWRAGAAEMRDSAWFRQVGRRGVRNCEIMESGAIES